MEKTFNAYEVKKMLGESMQSFSQGMIDLIRECATHHTYRDLKGQDALLKVADKLTDLQRKNAP